MREKDEDVDVAFMVVEVGGDRVTGEAVARLVRAVRAELRREIKAAHHCPCYVCAGARVREGGLDG